MHLFAFAYKSRSHWLLVLVLLRRRALEGRTHMLVNVNGDPTMRGQNSVRHMRARNVCRTTATVMRARMAVMQVLSHGCNSRRLEGQNPRVMRLTLMRLTTTPKRMYRYRCDARRRTRGSVLSGVETLLLMLRVARDRGRPTSSGMRW